MNASANNARPPQRRGLGRGLGSLIPTAPSQEPPLDDLPETHNGDVPRSGSDRAQDGVTDGRAPAVDGHPPTTEATPPPAEVAGAYFA
jgi:ParB family chromosome partitioning protein